MYFVLYYLMPVAPTAMTGAAAAVVMASPSTAVMSPAAAVRLNSSGHNTFSQEFICFTIQHRFAARHISIHCRRILSLLLFQIGGGINSCRY